MMATKQQPKHVADLLSSKVVLTKKPAFEFFVNTTRMAHITINYFTLACVGDCGMLGGEERCMLGFGGET